MIELNIIVRPEGVVKTQVLAPDEEQAEGVRLYTKLLPHISQIDATLRERSEQSAKGAGRG